MSSTISLKESLTLDDLVLRYGAIELQYPVEKADFIALAKLYPELQMEREKTGITTIMSPVSRGSGKREFQLNGYFFIWHQKTKLGEFYSPSTGFDLPDGAIKSPDIAWISQERLAELPKDGEKGFIPLVPDFIVEIRSQSDRLKKLQTKMTETWIANGVRLAWLIDPYEEKAYIYRQNDKVEVIAGFTANKLFGEDVLPGFELNLEIMC